MDETIFYLHKVKVSIQTRSLDQTSLEGSTGADLRGLQTEVSTVTHLTFCTQQQLATQTHPANT